MPKSRTASDKLMGDYFTALLQEEPTQQLSSKVKVKEPETASVAQREVIAREPIEKLLKQVETQVSKPLKSANELRKETKEKIPATVKVAERMPARPKHIEPEPELSVAETRDVTTKKASYREGEFQALFFDVAGLTLAVPLITLGGIHELDHINSLMGKPPWFKGVMLHREKKINVVDSALWVMPEKCDDNLLTELDYRFLIMLGDSDWGLMAENLIDTVTLSQDDVKWREQPGKRPWLAGLVKDRMCALVDVDAMVDLLNHGLSVSSE